MSVWIDDSGCLVAAVDDGARDAEEVPARLGTDAAEFGTPRVLPDPGKVEPVPVALGVD
jgi:hypothetical protein